MRKRLSNLDAVVSSLKPYLNQYLEEQGIDTSNNFCCINPKHEDSTPSMTTKQVPECAFCFGCSNASDIFQAAHFLEGKPAKGAGWIEDNVLYLAEKFEIHVDLEDLTQEEIYEYRTYEAYKYASQLVSDPTFGDYAKADKEITRRGWEKEKCENWGVGTVNYSEYKTAMKAAGYEPGFLGGVDLDRSNMFDNHNLIFTVYDDKGRPVGFSSRNLNYKKEDKKTGSKYNNTKVTGLECAIFKKGERLYGFDIAKEVHGPLYIFEGQADVVTARHFGIMNSCCTLGTAFSDHHVNLLKRNGLFKLIFVFDADEGGETAIQKVLDEKFADAKGFRIQLVQLPAGQDPDELLRDEGIEEFLKMKKWSAFEWRMMKFMNQEQQEGEEFNPQEVADKMIRIIISEDSLLRQEEMAKQVAKMTGYDLSTIMSEVKRQQNEKESQAQNKKLNALEAIVWEAKKNPENINMAVEEARIAVENIDKEMESSSNSGAACLTFLQTQKEMDEAKTGEFAGFHMSPEGLGNLAARLNDDWKSDTLIFCAGTEQAGKTSLCAQMAYEIASDERNNAICIYHSIDDSAKFILYKWIARAAAGINLQLGHISHPNYWSQQEGHNWIPDLRESAYKDITRLVTDEKLVLKDASSGSSLAYAEALAKSYRQRFPEKNVVLFIDNFHKLTDFGHLNGHERTKRLCNHLKNTVTTHGITVVSTAEYRKLDPGQMGTNASLAETRSLAYDASVILHLYNELHMKPESESVLIHEHEDMFGQMKTLPRILVKFGKNKVSGFEGREFLDFYPAAATLKSIPLDIAVQDQKQRMAFLKDNGVDWKY